MLDNKMLIDQIDLKEYLDSNKFPTLKIISQDEYDLIQTKDPCRIYVIKDAVDKRVYYGSIRVVDSCADRSYLMGSSNKYGEYTLFLNEKEGMNDRLVEITRFDSPQKAINALNHFNRVGSHYKWALQTYNLLTSYMQTYITCNELLVGIISLFGYRDDPRFQELVSTVTSYMANENQVDIPLLLREDLPKWSADPRNHLYKYYSSLYDLVVKYNHFKSRRFADNNIDLSDVINDIIKIIISIH